MSEWIEWNGGENPVPRFTKVDVEFRNGEFSKGLWGQYYEGWGSTHDHWRHEGSGRDIIRYRVLEDNP